MEENVIKHNYRINKNDRNKLLGHSSFLVFFTGLSGSGKSTLANILEQKLHEKNIATYTLDGDNIRKGINSDLTFSPVDRSENNRRIGEIANLFVEAGIVVLAAFVAPYKKDREVIKNAVGSENYVEVFVDTSLEECEKRDVKGLYKKARLGEIKDMTGISSPYEKPESPNVTVTEKLTIEQSIEAIWPAVTKKLNSSNE